MKIDKPTRGGARKGAGRKPGILNVHQTFTLPATTVELLLAAVPAGDKSRFVNEAILKALRRQNPGD